MNVSTGFVSDVLPSANREYDSRNGIHPFSYSEGAEHYRDQDSGDHHSARGFSSVHGMSMAVQGIDATRRTIQCRP